MSRKTGTYPKYEKLDIDPKIEPDAYWRSSRRCTKCQFRWPNLDLFKASICCGFDTTVYNQGPDLRWSEAVKELLRHRFNQFYDKYNEGLNEDEIDWLSEDLELDDAEVDNILREIEAELDDLSS